MMSEGDFLDFDPGQFLIPHGFWFIIPRGKWDLAGFCAALHRTRNPDGTFVVAFTDRDLADTYLQQGGDAAAAFQVGRPRSNAALVALLDQLLAMGETHLAADISPNGWQRISIADHVRQIRAVGGSRN